MVVASTVMRWEGSDNIHLFASLPAPDLIQNVIKTPGDFTNSYKDSNMTTAGSKANIQSKSNRLNSHKAKYTSKKETNFGKPGWSPSVHLVYLRVFPLSTRGVPPVPHRYDVPADGPTSCLASVYNREYKCAEIQDL